mmetsp:Transcript_15866/g.31663  ORF Transcript_15866/g.31663 Transcript_15866/m.31663 type:complete len:137 (+) Transcript_15866:187-597(+)
MSIEHHHDQAINSFAQSFLTLHTHPLSLLPLPQQQTTHSNPPETILTKASLTLGTETNAVAQTAVKTMLIAANGKASFSGIIAATPNPCPAAPIPNPLLTGSLIFNASNKSLPTVAPKMPVSTTTLAAMAISPSKI